MPNTSMTLQELRDTIVKLEEERTQKFLRVVNYTAKFNQGTLAAHELTMAEQQYQRILLRLEDVRRAAKSLASLEDTRDASNTIVKDPLDDYRTKIAAAETDLGELTLGNKIDLLLDNFPEITDSVMAAAIVEKLAE